MNRATIRAGYVYLGPGGALRAVWRIVGERVDWTTYEVDIPCQRGSCSVRRFAVWARLLYGAIDVV